MQLKGAGKSAAYTQMKVKSNALRPSPSYTNAISVLYSHPSEYNESEMVVTLRRRHPLIERRHLALLHMAPGQHRLIKRVPLPLPLAAAKRPQ